MQKTTEIVNWIKINNKFVLYQINEVDIHNFTQHYKMEDLSNMIEKCDVWMEVHYDDDEEDEVVQQMDQRLQDVFSKLPRNVIFEFIFSNRQDL